MITNLGNTLQEVHSKNLELGSACGEFSRMFGKEGEILALQEFEGYEEHGNGDYRSPYNRQ